jgi:hypothetical protein
LLPRELAWAYVAGQPAPPAPSTARRLVVSDAEPPASLGLGRLSPFTPPHEDSQLVWLHGRSATPSRVLAELADSTEVLVHAHGLVDLRRSDASMIALSPDSDGEWALTAARVQGQKMAGHPVVILAACHAAKVAPYSREPWSLPLAFREAGARAVLATPEPIPDAEAGPFFDALLARMRAGASAAVALRDERLARPPSAWLSSLIAFE